jgi:hypothetical protein
MKNILLGATALFAFTLLPLSAYALSPSVETTECLNTPEDLRSEECREIVKVFIDILRRWNVENRPVNHRAGDVVGGGF